MSGMHTNRRHEGLSLCVEALSKGSFGLSLIGMDWDGAQPPSCYRALVARRATARRRSPDRILVAREEIKMPSIGGSQWEALSLMHAAERQA
eukprot:1151900-Pelagomonas_calceolata.AAC.4